MNKLLDIRSPVAVVECSPMHVGGVETDTRRRM